MPAVIQLVSGEFFTSDVSVDAIMGELADLGEKGELGLFSTLVAHRGGKPARVFIQSIAFMQDVEDVAPFSPPPEILRG